MTTIRRTFLFAAVFATAYLGFSLVGCDGNRDIIQTPANPTVPPENREPSPSHQLLPTAPSPPGSNNDFQTAQNEFTTTIKVVFQTLAKDSLSD